MTDAADAADAARVGSNLAGMGYEQARDELVSVVRELEAGGLSLEQSLALWEKGEALARACERHLEGARKRIDDKLASVADNGTAGTAGEGSGGPHDDPE